MRTVKGPLGFTLSYFAFWMHHSRGFMNLKNVDLIASCMWYDVMVEYS